MSATAREQQELPSEGGSYERTEGGELKRVETTQPAEDRAAPEPDERGSARPADEEEPQRKSRRSAPQPQGSQE